MRNSLLTGVSLALFAIVRPALAAGDVALTRMALCQDSWIEWTKKDRENFEAFRDHVAGAFRPHDKDPWWLPKTNISVLGMHVAQAFPDSVGMGVGFSLFVDAPYDKARAEVEKALGKTLQHCEASDGMKTCELEVAAQRTVTIMAEDSSKSRQTLIGCYYYYEN